MSRVTVIEGKRGKMPSVSYDNERNLFYVPVLGTKEQRTYLTREEAITEQMRQYAAKMEGVKITAPTTYTLSELLDRWFEYKVLHDCGATTQYGYANIIKHIKNSPLARISLRRLEASMIEDYYYKYLLGKCMLSPNTVRKHHDLLIQALKYARKMRFMQHNPIEYVTPPKLQHIEKVPCTASDVATMLKHFPSNTTLGVLIRLAIYTGMRRGEIAGLRWDCIDFKQRIIHVRSTRTKCGNQTIVKMPKTRTSTRDIPMSDELYDTLIALKSYQDKMKTIHADRWDESNYVLIRNDGKPFSVNYLNNMLTDGLKREGLEHITPHICRHTVASLMNEGNISSYNISKYLGHSSDVITRRVYLHSTNIDEQNRQALSVAVSLIDKERRSH